jgi:hypothetical protein
MHKARRAARTASHVQPRGVPVGAQAAWTVGRSRNRKTIHELRIKDGFSFLDTRKKFFENRHKTGNHSYACHLVGVRKVLMPEHKNAALLNRDSISTLPRTAVSTQRLPRILKMLACQPPALDVIQPENVR